MWTGSLRTLLFLYCKIVPSFFYKTLIHIQAPFFHGEWMNRPPYCCPPPPHLRKKKKKMLPGPRFIKMKSVSTWNNWYKLLKSCVVIGCQQITAILWLISCFMKQDPDPHNGLISNALHHACRHVSSHSQAVQIHEQNTLPTLPTRGQHSGFYNKQPLTLTRLRKWELQYMYASIGA